MKLLKIGGLALYASGTSYILIILLYSFFLGPEKLSALGPAHITQSLLAAYSQHPIYTGFHNLLLAFFGIWIALAVVAVRAYFYPQVREHRNTLLVAGTISATLFLAGGMTGFAGLHGVASVGDVSAFRAINAISTSLSGAGSFAAGIVLILIGLAGRSTKKLPALLCYVLLVDGAVDLFIPFIPFFIYIDSGLAIIYSFWLGKILLNAKSSA